MKIIKIFLASSSSLLNYRELFEIDVNRINKDWVLKEMFLDLIVWEGFEDYMVKEGKQSEYDQAVSGCDIFVMIFSDSVGKYSMEEFTFAYNTFKDSDLDLPKIFTYYIKPTDGGLMSASTKDFMDKLAEFKHYPSQVNNFDEVRQKFLIDLNALTQKVAYFYFPDNDAKVVEKVEYIKMLHLADKTKNAEPVYKKYISRLQQEAEIFDEAQFAELMIYSGKPDSNMAYNYSQSRGTIDMDIIVPRQEESNQVQQLHEDDSMSDQARAYVDMTSNVFYSVTNFINAFQRGDTFYQTRADQSIAFARLIVDFSSLPGFTTIHKTEPTAKRYNERKAADIIAVSVTQIKPGIYKCAMENMSPGDVVVMNFDIDWDKINEVETASATLQ